MNGYGITHTLYNGKSWARFYVRRSDCQVHYESVITGKEAKSDTLHVEQARQLYRHFLDLGYKPKSRPKESA